MSICKQATAVTISALLVALLTGCEAPLNLEGVVAEQATSVRRYDQLQAVVAHEEKFTVVGAAGIVLVSNDSGSTWQRVQLPKRPSLIDISRCPDGGYVSLDTEQRLWMSDGAATEWRSQTISTEEHITAITCDSNGNIWAIGSFSTILFSTDMGQSWTDLSLGDDVQLTAVQFLDSSNGFITGEFGTVLRSTDGGVSWERGEDLPNEFYPQSTFFATPEKGWVVGLAGTILHTEDGGSSWQLQNSGIEVPLYGVSGGSDAVYAVGENGVVLRYAAGTWQPHPLHDVSTRSYLRGIAVTDNDIVIAGGGGVVFSLPAGA